jgi:hypothetical protein
MKRRIRNDAMRLWNHVRNKARGSKWAMIIVFLAVLLLSWYLVPIRGKLGILTTLMIATAIFVVMWELIRKRTFESSTIVLSMSIIATACFIIVTSDSNKIAKRANALMEQDSVAAERTNRLMEEDLLFQLRPSLYMHQISNGPDSKGDIDFEIINMGESYALLPELSFDILIRKDKDFEMNKLGYCFLELPLKLDPWEQHKFKLNVEAITVLTLKHEMAEWDSIHLKEYFQKTDMFFVATVSYRRANDFKDFSITYVDYLHYDSKSRRLALRMGLQEMWNTPPTLLLAAKSLRERYGREIIYVKGAPYIGNVPSNAKDVANEGR